MVLPVNGEAMLTPIDTDRAEMAEHNARSLRRRAIGAASERLAQTGAATPSPKTWQPDSRRHALRAGAAWIEEAAFAATLSDLVRPDSWVQGVAPRAGGAEQCVLNQRARFRSASVGGLTAHRNANGGRLRL